MTWLKNHQSKMLDYFVYLHLNQPDYAPHAFKVYESVLLYPTLKQELEISLRNLRKAKGGTRDGEKPSKPGPSRPPLRG
jgi:hypothetical protein